MSWSIKKPLGGKNSFVNQTLKRPLPALIGGATLGLTGGLLGAGVTGLKADAQNKQSEYDRQLAGLNAQGQASGDELTRLASEEEAKRRALGEKQRGQINAFADDVQGSAAKFRTGLAQSLSDTGQQFFNRLNPAILEDLNSRGLFTSQTARDTEQSKALKDIALQNENSLRGFDTDIFNQVNDIRGTGLSANLGGDQSALDSALGLRKASIQRRFDQQDSQREQAFAEMLAGRQSRDSLVASLLGLGGRLGAAGIGAA